MGEATQGRWDFGFLASLVAALVLMLLCTQLPLLLASRNQATAGLVVVAVGFIVWKRFGPPPGPGYLTGTLCLAGWVACVVSVVGCGWVAVRSWL